MQYDVILNIIAAPDCTALNEENCRDANFVITGGNGGCHDDNLKCHQWWQRSHHDNPHFVNFVIIGRTGGCHDDNLQCHQWWQSWHHNNSHFVNFVIIGGTGLCHDNLQCHHWWQSWHHGNSVFNTVYPINYAHGLVMLCFVVVVLLIIDGLMLLICLYSSGFVFQHWSNPASDTGPDHFH